MKIDKGLLVVLDYQLLDEEHEPVESSADEGPMMYVHGDGHVPPALEERLLGSEVGDKLEVTLEPGEAFGEYDPEGILSVARAEFPEDAALEIDEWIEIVVTPEEGEEAQEGGELQARVVEIGDDNVILDTNLPLAGRRITFKVEVTEVREPTEEDRRELEELTS